MAKSIAVKKTTAGLSLTPLLFVNLGTEYSLADIEEGLTINGLCPGSENGTSILVTFNGNSYNTVAFRNRFSVVIPPEDLVDIEDGDFEIKAFIYISKAQTITLSLDPTMVVFQKDGIWPINGIWPSTGIWSET